MSYLNTIEYNIIPLHSFNIIRNCSGCKRKAISQNTNQFRVNANGNKLDVWLIYQCENCKHTQNITIYERMKPDQISSQEYVGFLSNSQELAFEYGTKIQFFAKNKMEIDWSKIAYQIKERVEETCIPNVQVKDIINESMCIKLVIHNPYYLKVRDEKVVSELLGISRSKMKEWIELGRIAIVSNREKHILSVIVEGEAYGL